MVIGMWLGARLMTLCCGLVVVEFVSSKLSALICVHLRLGLDLVVVFYRRWTRMDADGDRVAGSELSALMCVHLRLGFSVPAFGGFESAISN
jgi:hypothetical protein